TGVCGTRILRRRARRGSSGRRGGAAIGCAARRLARRRTRDCYTTVAATRLVQALTSAFNAGDDRAVDRLFAPEPYFQWFAAWGRSRTSGRLGERADDRTTLRSYVRERHLHRERWTIVHSQGNGRGIAFSLI